jgi:hypothetical protein
MLLNSAIASYGQESVLLICKSLFKAKPHSRQHKAWVGQFIELFESWKGAQKILTYCID